jgi:4-hydroxybutyrate CoA-transferase
MRRASLASAAGRALDGRGEVTIVAAMAPQQPDDLLTALLRAARARAIPVRLLVADITGEFRFLDEEAGRDLTAGRLAITLLAGSVPRRLAPLVDSVPASLGEIDRLLADGALACDIFAVRMQRTRRGLEVGNAVGYTMTMLARPGVTVMVEAAADDSCVPGLYPVTAELPAGAIVCGAGRRPAGARAATGPAANPVRERIAGHLARLIPPDATLQVGIGGVAESLIAALAGRQHIGFHSGILPTALRARLAAGDFTGDAKTVDRGLAVCTSLGPDAGAQPWPAALRLRPLAETHAPEALARHERLWAVNSAFSVDLRGQVNAEWAGGLKVACGGGQLDFARAAHRSPHGASVIALPARTARGQSRIVARLDPGGAVTTPASDIDFVVTEYGTARLGGRTLGERARALAAVAHPDDRASLLAGRAAG